MLLHLTAHSGETLQGQIVRQVRARILRGELGADSLLPSIRGLARDHRVSVITVQRAYESLEREGLIHSRPGKGFYVSELSTEGKQKMSQQQLLDRLRLPVEAALAEGLDPEEIRRVVEQLLQRQEEGEEGSR